MNFSTLHKFQLLSPIIILLLCSKTYSQPEFLAYICGDKEYNYTIDRETYKSNLHKLLSSISSNPKINYGFYNLTIGQKLDQVYSVALCRGDIATSECKTCINYAASRIEHDCPNWNSGLGYYTECMIRYSNTDIFKGEMSQPRYHIYTTINGTYPKRYNSTVSNLMSKLAYKAAFGDFRKKYATGEAQVTNKLRVYALLQCIPDLEEYDCLNCLNLIINYTIFDCCYGKEGARVGGPTCNLRYENYLFYDSPIPLPPLVSPSLPLLPPTSGQRTRAAIIIGIPVVMLVVLVILMCFYLKIRDKSLKRVENEGREDEIKMIESLQLDFATIKNGTDNFSNSNKIGQGGFGTVYKGKLPNGQMIAVKRLNTNTGYGEKEFKNEALLMSKLQHRNLVQFLGFCLLKEERLLVYEFLPNKSLDHNLFGPTSGKYLVWEKRHKIINGIARGLLYLHEESRLLVVHRDLKAGNVLLDYDMNPKISDFGVARLFGTDQSHAYTSKIAGTCGYMPPEYVINGNFSIKTDVFSFGVLVLEIISGQKVSKFSNQQNGESLVSFAWRNWCDGNALRIVDSKMSTTNTNEVLRCINIALLCVQENAALRPIMSSILIMLTSLSMTLPIPSRPAFLIQSDIIMNSNSHLETHKNTSQVSFTEVSLSTSETL